MYRLRDFVKRLCHATLLATLAAGMTLLLCTSCAAEPIHIISDSSTYNYKTGSTFYEGSVKVVQGTTTLTADRVVTTTNKQNKIEEVIAYGVNHLADYSTIIKKGSSLIHARAKIMRFYPIKSTLMLEGEVTVTQGENSFQGPLVIYNIKDQTITAPASKTGRSTILIGPGQIKS